ncbi:MAG: LLM class flavin-dependent oxidoreductase [Actinomycetota bacterium]
MSAITFGLGQFTLQIPPWDARSPAELYADTLELAAFAESAGFDSFWLAEHHGSNDSYIPALLPFLSAVAARTTTLQIGTAVMLAPFHDPLRLAEDAAVVDNVSGGRLNLGLGLGWVPDEYRMFGVPMEGRGKRMEEIVEILRQAWTGERFTHTGRFYTFEDAAVTPRPAHHIPILLGGAAELAIERAAVMGDGHVSASTTTLEAVVETAGKIAAIRRERGVAGPYRFGCFMPAGFGDDEAQAWASIRDGVLHVRGSYVTWSMGGRDVANARDTAAQWEDANRANAVLGTPAQVAERLKGIVEGLASAGFDDIVLSVGLAPPGTPLERAKRAVETFAEKVVPALR